MGNKKLDELYKKVDKCKFCEALKNKLQHIFGYGMARPKFMLILVNPTYKNLSSAPGYKGPRFPFIGVRQFWRVLADGGLIDKKIAYSLSSRSQWENGDTERVQKELVKNKIFITNVVKCCYSHGKYPKTEVIDYQLDFLKEEIKIVRPQNIIAFGNLVYKILTGKNIKLFEYWKKRDAKRDKEVISGLNIPVIPVWFPIGRGNPKKAVEILRKLRN